MRTILLLAISLFTTIAVGQATNILSTNAQAAQVLKGNYNPANYVSATVIDHHDAIFQGIQNNVNPDSLKSYLEQLVAFGTRHTASDTLSNTRGIGAARRWAMRKFQEFSAANDNRLLASYLQFDLTVCSMGQHRNIYAVLPGSDTSNHEVILIEGHLDSRCEGDCDTICDANGAEDNGSGSVLVLELARVMSRYTYKHSIVFMLTIGEEQGLYGAEAFAQYAVSEGIPLKAVLNNDVVGGILCGQTSSAPSCPGLDDVDSTQLRLFSYGSNNSAHKNLARFIKLEYQEELLPLVTVPMQVSIMSSEDRSGRGGDHIPFRQRGFPSMRFTAANEHGNADVGPGYTDRQHTDRDILGVDTNNDQIIDSFFVDFNYLARNACINAVAATVAAIGPRKPDFSMTLINNGGLVISITNETQYPQYRIGVRRLTNDWDSVYTINSIQDTIYMPTNGFYSLSVASVDSLALESLFSIELQQIVNNVISAVPMLPSGKAGIRLLQNKPNPFDFSTSITVRITEPVQYKEAFIRIQDLLGRNIKTLPIRLDQEYNELLFEHGYGASGVLLYSLIVDGEVIATQRMVFE